MEGTAFGRYQLIELLGRGGMGEVWRARDTSIDRIVALKMLLPRYAKDPEYDARFRREALAAARLDDPHVVPIYDIGELDGRLYVTMRLVNGRDLQTELDRSGPLPPTRIVHVVEQVASALHSAHRAGLVHRDVKPSNVLLTDSDTETGSDYAYLIDFGIARAAGDTQLTAANTMLGTWAYMAPERFATADSGPGVDVYALACVLYQGLTGELPFPGETFEQVAISHMVMPPPKPSAERDGIPIALDHVIATGLAKEPSQRYQTAVELAAAARAALTGTAPIAPRRPALGPATPPRPSDVTEPWQSGSTAPTMLAPVVAAQPSSRRPRTARWIAGAAAAVALAVAVTAGVVGLSGTDAEPAGPGPSRAVPPPPTTGPFTGTYRAEIGGTAAEFAVWSVCGTSGCVATARKYRGDGPLPADPVFDEVGDVWLSVTVSPGQCGGATGETWQTLRLRPRPDGALVGERTVTTGAGCAERQAVTFTRTGDVPAGADLPPDPARLPPRVVSPAEALRGRYLISRTFTSQQPPRFEETADVVTDCVRTGERCSSYVSFRSGDVAMLYGGEGWQWSVRTSASCPGGATAPLAVDARFPLPQPPRNPLASLTGTGTWMRDAPCPQNVAFGQTFTRTGD